MAKRITNIGVILEYIGTLKTRLTNIGITMEYKGSPNRFRATNIGIQLEYRETVLLDMLKTNLRGNRTLNGGGRVT